MKNERIQELREQISIARECNCSCHDIEEFHMIPCCDASGRLIKDLEKEIRQLSILRNHE